MTHGHDGGPTDIEAGLNTTVVYGGQRYHVQTQCSQRGAPVIESLVFLGGQTLVRMTASFDDVAQRLGFNGEDGKHLLELQHDDLIRKIRHGMLRDNDDGVPEETEQAAPSTIELCDDLTLDPSQVEDPEVRELLQKLGVALDQAGPATLPETPSRPAGPLPRRRRS